MLASWAAAHSRRRTLLRPKAIGLHCRVLAPAPEFVICDKVTSALDHLVAEEVLKLLDRLQCEYDLSYTFITHDIGTVCAIADDVLVMFQGKVVESGPKAEMFVLPHHE